MNNEFLEKQFEIMLNNAFNKENKSGVLKKETNLPESLTDFTEECKNMSFVPTRNYEIRVILEILTRKNKSNVLLIGESGVGKTSIVEQIAWRISNKMVPDFFLGYKIFFLDHNTLISNTSFRGMYEAKINEIKKFLIENKNSILFIDEINSVANSNKYGENDNNLLSILKTELSRNKIKIIGTTTSYEFAEVIQNDNALSRRIQNVYINETSSVETSAILLAEKKELENHHSVFITKEAINYCLKVCNKFILDKYFPDKAIELLDLTCSKVKMKKYDLSLTHKDNKEENELTYEILKTKDKIDEIKNDITELKEVHNLEELSLKENILLTEEQEKLSYLTRKIKNINPNFKIEVTKEDIMETLNSLKIIKQEIIDGNFIKKILKAMKESLFIAEKEIETICSSIQKKSNLEFINKENKTLSTFLIMEKNDYISKEIINWINKIVSFNKVNVCEVNLKDIAYMNDYTFWKEKINKGHRVFYLKLEKNSRDSYLFHQIKKILKTGRERNRQTNISLSGAVFFFKINEQSSSGEGKRIEYLINNYLNEEEIKLIDEVIYMPEFNNNDKLNIFLKVLNKKEYQPNIDNSLKKLIVSRENDLNDIIEIALICKELIKNLTQESTLYYDENQKKVLLIEKKI